MDKKDIFRLAGDPRFISGIYNYCDRWCERCPFTSRCLTYAIDEKDIDDPASRDINNEKFWKNLEEIFKQTSEMIMEIAKEKGIDSSSIDVDEISKKLDSQMAEADNHELCIAARRYGKEVSKWFEKEQWMFEKKEEELNSLLNIGIGENRVQAEAAGIKDAMDVIHWYQHQIYVKLKRTLVKDDSIDEEEILINDANGSVKVALIGMDRSIGAWGKLHEFFPEKTNAILDILLHLDRLRRRTEELFPQARSFKRPGFDTIN